MKSRATKIVDLRATLKDFAPKFDVWYTLSPKLRDQLAKEEENKELKELADIRKELSSLEIKEPLHLKRLLQLKIFHINFEGVKQHLKQKEKDLEQENKLKFDAIEQT